MPKEHLGAPKLLRCVAEGCGKEFPAPLRRQGGGKTSKYCSATCRSRDWSRNNPQKRAEVLERYEAKPGAIERKRARTRKATLAKYGVTETWFDSQLARQRYKCPCCTCALTRESARIDHDHASGKVRGLLCDSCNWALGHAKDSPLILRRLMAYLHKDITVPLIYVGGALKNERVKEVGQALRHNGFDAMDEWITPGPEADSFLHGYEKQRGRIYRDSLRGRAAENVVLFDQSYIDQSDAFVMLAPCGKSAYMELGYAVGAGIPTFILLEDGDPERFDVMPAMAGKVVYSIEELLVELAKLPNLPNTGVECSV